MDDWRAFGRIVIGVDVERLGRSVKHLTQEELWSVDESILTVLGLG